CWSARAGSSARSRSSSTPCASRPMLPDWLPWLLQVNDSQYPSGAYAHSLGLEELVECGAVTDAAGLEDFLGAQIVPSLCAFELPILAEAHRAAQAGDTARLADLDFE